MDGLIRYGVPLRDYTTLRVGGKADRFAEPDSEEALIRLAQEAAAQKQEVLVLGNGSNLLVSDSGFRGLAIRLGPAFALIRTDGTAIEAQAGALLSVLAKRAEEAGLTGLEFAHGIPGTVGGACVMNAGAYGGEMSQVLESVRVWDGVQIRDVPVTDMHYGYRQSEAMRRGWLVLGARFRLREGDREQIAAAMADLMQRRREKQPLEYPSAGSFFKRPEGYFAGALIEQAGLKGCMKGGAQVSEKHAGFLINRGGATAQDFISLMHTVQDTVLKKDGVKLEPEVRFVGDFGQEK